MAVECELVEVQLSIFHLNKCHSSSFATQPLVVSSVEDIPMTLVSSHDFHPANEWLKKSALDINDYHNDSIFHASRLANAFLYNYCLPVAYKLHKFLSHY